VGKVKTYQGADDPGPFLSSLRVGFVKLQISARGAWGVGHHTAWSRADRKVGSRPRHGDLTLQDWNLLFYVSACPVKGEHVVRCLSRRSC
jgi:hypothetical protein